ncbi:MAG TPA: orotidine-5'-phosphate decarboxylase [Bryobacteraceae bacterium]|nr:orotidine-5'-phosphate decarboxylase [Bryobacteraceae bacterium]
MKPFAGRLVESIRKTGNPCSVGLDPRIHLMPGFITSGRTGPPRDIVRSTISEFHELVLDAIAGLVPAVKPQLAFFEQYGVGGMEAFENTVRAARQRGLLVIADAKRNDISSTAEAYAKAFLSEQAFDADAMTVTPYLGRDSLLPFVELCGKNGKGLFVVLKTSNPGSRDYQDQALQSTGQPLYESVAATIDELGRELIGESGYSAIGAVIGATFPEEARRLRELLPHSFILVPGYGAQGATGQSAAACFHANGLGAIVNSSRGITYSGADQSLSRQEFVKLVRENTRRMIEDVTSALTVTSAAPSYPAASR